MTVINIITMLLATTVSEVSSLVLLQMKQSLASSEARGICGFRGHTYLEGHYCTYYDTTKAKQSCLQLAQNVLKCSLLDISTLDFENFLEVTLCQTLSLSSGYSAPIRAYPNPHSGIAGFASAMVIVKTTSMFTNARLIVQEIRTSPTQAPDVVQAMLPSL